MAIVYRQGANDDLAPLASVGIDDDSATSWWGGAQKCFVAVALATLLATTTLSTALSEYEEQGEQSDVPAGNLVKVAIDDDSATAWWAGVQKCFSSIHASTVQSATALSTLLAEYEEQGEQSDVPAGSLFGQPDEDYWQNYVAPVQASLYRSPAVLDPDEIPAGFLLPPPRSINWVRSAGGDYPSSGVVTGIVNTAGNLGIASVWWLSTGTPPTITSITDTAGNTWVLIPGTHSTRASTTYGNISRQLAYCASLNGSGSNTVTCNFGAGTNSFQGMAIHEFSGSPVALDQSSSATGTAYPITGGSITTAYANELAFVAEFFDDTGFGPTGLPQPGTGFVPLNENPAGSGTWGAQWNIQSVAGSVSGAFGTSTAPTPDSYAGSIASFNIIQPDEDFWTNPVAPIPAKNYVALPLGQDDVFVVASVATLGADEDFWQNPVLPVPASLYQRLPLGDPEEIPAASLFGQYDEDFWRNALAPVPASNLWPQPFSFDVQEPAGALYGQADEDFWINAVRSIPATLYRSPLLGDQEEIPGALLSANPDEDYWINAVRPVAASLYQNLPYLFDSGEFILAIPPVEDEDFWQNPVAPVQASLYRSPLFSDPEEVPAGSLKKFVSPDEDYWQNRVAPVAGSLYQQLPYLYDAGDLGFPTFDEDFWANPVAPIQAALYQRLPLGDPEEIPAGSEFGQYDEDFWVNPVAPVQASLYRSSLFPDPEEVPAGTLVSAKPDEDYWQNRVAPVQASLYQPLPYLYDSVDSGNLVAQAVTAQLGGGIAWPYPELSERHWSAPPSSTLPVKKGKKKPASTAGTATPAGLSAQVTLGTVVVSGSARAKAEGQTMRSSFGAVQILVAATLEPSSESHRVKRYGVAQLGRVKVRGIRNPSDEELLLILGEIG